MLVGSSVRTVRLPARLWRDAEPTERPAAFAAKRPSHALKKITYANPGGEGARSHLAQTLPLAGERHNLHPGGPSPPGPGGA